MKNTFAYVIVALTLIFGFLSIVYTFVNKNDTILTEMKDVLPTDHVKWSPDKKNVLVEYSDYYCPACKTIHDALNQMEATNSPDLGLTKKITLVYRQFPLYQIHPHAMEAAYAAEAAGKQGKFFEMSDLLFQNQASSENLDNPRDYFISLAGKLNLNIDKFKNDMDSKEVKDKVASDLKSAENGGLEGTPTFFINGKKINFNSIEEFKSVLKQSIQ